VIWVGIGVTGAHFFGVDGFLLLFLISVLGIGILSKMLSITRKRRQEKMLAMIDASSERSVRFDGSPEQAAHAMGIGISKGWIGEYLPSSDGRNMSICFTAIENAQSLRAFVEALFEAGLAGKVQP
jgi:hypothetical protein